ncbi:MAG: ATP-binding protein [Candidatus Bathyarchaeia archaeon]
MVRDFVYPFSAIVGQDKAKTALLLNAVDPNLGGVLLVGPKGSGKSTLVRAFGELLPDIEKVKDCPFNCNPRTTTNLCPLCRERLDQNGFLQTETRKMRIVELPLSATEDRLLGTLDVGEALKKGVKAFLPGLLAEANQNILYIDEVNLLPTHLVNSILDPAASGWCTVQREGFSFVHPAHFTLVASMNPEEGDISPQIRDRFALSAKIERLSDVASRVEITRRILAFEENPTAFIEAYYDEQNALRQKLHKARQLLSSVKVPDNILLAISEMCANLRVDGFRPDLSILKAARALAALQGKSTVDFEDVLFVSELALGHRMQPRGDTSSGGLDMAERLRQILYKQIPFTGKDEELPQLAAPTEEELAHKIAPPKRITRKRPRELPSILSYIILAGLMLMLLFTVSVAALSIRALIFGLPPGGIKEIFTLDQLLLTMGIAAACYAVIALLFPRPARKQAIYFYQSIGPRLRRQIVQVQRQREYPEGTDAEEQKDKEAQQKRHDRVLNIPLYASIGRLYKLVLNRGPKLLSGEMEDRRRYEFTLKRRKDRRMLGSAGRRTKIHARSERGRYVSYEFPKRRPWDIAIGPTLRAAAPYQLVRNPGSQGIKVKVEDIRVKVKESNAPLTIVILLDMSESMAASLPNIRNAILSMHDIAYKKHDRVGLVVFKGSEATTLQTPTTNLNLVVSKLKDLGASDLTPLAAGMFESWRMLRNERMKNRDIVPILVIISDGIANVSLNTPLSPFTRKRFLNHAQADVIDASFLLEREGIQTLVINPSHAELGDSYTALYKKEVEEKTGKQWLEPTELLMQIPIITGGYYYGIGEGGDLQSINLTEALNAFNVRTGYVY